MVFYYIIFGNISAIKATTLRVTFNKAVDKAKASFVVKRGTINTNIKSITWNENNTAADLVGFTAYPAGDYTVTVKGLEKEVSGNAKCEAQKVAKIEILGDVAVLSGVVGTAKTATVDFKVTDQYGEDVTSTFGGTLTKSTTATDGTTPIAISGSTITLTWATAPAKDQLVVVTLIDQATGTVGTKTLKVGLQSSASNITLSALKNKDSKVLRTNTTLATDVFAFDVNAVDQYGNTVKSATQLGNDYLVVAPTGLTTAWVSATSTEPAKLKVTGVPAVAGTYTITIVSKATGASTIATVAVEKEIALETLTLSTPSDLYILDEYVYIPFTAVDQYGNSITKYADLSAPGKVILSSTNATKYPVALEKNAVDGTARIKLSTGTGAAANDMVVVTAVANGKSSTITLKLNEKAIPTRIASISSDVAKKMVVGATSTIAHTDFVIKDQYERDMVLPASWSIKLTSSATAYVTAGTGITTVATKDLTGVAAGSSTITATLNDGTSDKANSSIEFVAETVAKTAITGFEIEVPEKVFVNATAYGSASAEEKAYAVDMVIYGKTANGDRVSLASGDVVNVSSTNTKVDLTNAVGQVYANGTLAAGVTEEPATIVAIVKGANDVVTTVTKNITLTNAAKVGGEIAVKATKADYLSFADGVVVMTSAKVTAMGTKVMSADSATKASVYFEVKDQYGVACAAVKPAYYTISAKKADGTAYTTEYAINATTGEFTIASHTPVSGDEITVTAITSTGKVKSVKIIVE